MSEETSKEWAEGFLAGERAERERKTVISMQRKSLVAALTDLCDNAGEWDGNLNASDVMEILKKYEAKGQ